MSIEHGSCSVQHGIDILLFYWRTLINISMCVCVWGVSLHIIMCIFHFSYENHHITDSHSILNALRTLTTHLLLQSAFESFKCICDSHFDQYCELFSMPFDESLLLLLLLLLLSISKCRTVYARCTTHRT